MAQNLGKTILLGLLSLALFPNAQGVSTTLSQSQRVGGHELEVVPSSGYPQDDQEKIENMPWSPTDAAFIQSSEQMKEDWIQMSSGAKIVFFKISFFFVLNFETFLQKLLFFLFWNHFFEFLNFNFFQFWIFPKKKTGYSRRYRSLRPAGLRNPVEVLW